jgi:hypothetical protein
MRAPPCLLDDRPGHWTVLHCAGPVDLYRLSLQGERPTLSINSSMLWGEMVATKSRPHYDSHHSGRRGFVAEVEA